MGQYQSKHMSFSMWVLLKDQAFAEDKMLWFNVFDNVLKNAKHRANDASNVVNRPPLGGGGGGMEGMFYGAYNRQGRQMTVASRSCNWFMMRRKQMIMFIVMLMPQSQNLYVSFKSNC